MFQKILIANRGEIAIRIMKTCQKLNIKTVAVYSEADERAPHVKEADESFLIGGSRVNESYLNIDKIISVAKDAQVDAIHPGYGLLSENSQFAKRCEEEGITFIGPSPTAIEKMGSKIEARQLMEKAGIPTIPGTNHSIDSVDEAIKIAKGIGYPVMLKASHGGGGIGMQRVDDEEELMKAFESNSKRAEQFFGSKTMFIEKVIENAHHIEIQILADQHGNTVHIFERECSIQRRHQKIVEESPSPLLTEETRSNMGTMAIKAAEAIGYTNAGTIEFLVDEKQNFYFLEMNARLQVEHPVTEEITGIDLVHEQIKIASGKKLTFQQDDLKIDGHAIEVRIYAEDPNTFFPSPGQITHLQLPEGEGIRNDIAIENNMKVTPFYDPMIGKLIAKGSSRKDAIEKLNKALNTYEIEGIKTNIPLLQKIARNEAFHKGLTRTSFITEQLNNN